MTRNEIETKVNAFLLNDLKVEEDTIYPESLLKEDMGIDSLDYIDIVIIVEKLFGFKITNPAEMSGIKTLNQFYDYIESRMK